MIPASSVTAFQQLHDIQIHYGVGPSRLKMPMMPDYDALLHDNNWMQQTQHKSLGEFLDIPPRLLHLTGYGNEFEKHCETRIDADLAAARVNNIYNKANWSAPDPNTIIPDLHFSRLPDTTLSSVTFTVSNDCRLDPQFLPNIISNRVCFKQIHDSAILPIIYDTGCSYAMTYDISDFESPPITGKFGHVTTASGTLDITGFGIARWRVQTSDGSLDEIRVPCHLIPDATQRLFSPQDYTRFHQMSSHTDQFGGTCSQTWIRLTSGKILCSNVDPVTNIPVILAAHHSCDTAPTCACQSRQGTCSDCSQRQEHQSHVGLFDDDNLNLTQAQRELLLDHQRLGHINFQHLQALYRASKIHAISNEVTETRTALDFDEFLEDEPCCLKPRASNCSSCPRPKCQACLIANAKRRPRPHQNRYDDPAQQGLLSTNDLTPGANVSVDHYESPVRGRLLSTRGREPERNRYSGGTIFVDHASGLVHVEHQVSLGGADTIRSKLSFEQMAHTSGVEIKSYHADNGIFAARDYTRELQNRGQNYDFSGVGAHHQNGRAERAIQTVVWKARSMMIHQHIMWPDEYDAKQWPLALSYAAFIHNHTPRQDNGFAPMEIFTGSRMNCHYLRRCRVWGSPAYVLDPKLQDGRKIPKWQPRARLGQFLGFSNKHSSTVGLIRNLKTGSISPQYHVVIDEKFETIASSRRVDMTERWETLFQTSREHYLPEHNPDLDGPLPPLDDEWLEQDEYKNREQQNRRPPEQQHQPPIIHNQQPQVQLEQDDA